MSGSGTGTVINYGSGSDFLTSYCSGSGSTSQQVTVPTVPVLVPQRCVEEFHLWYLGAAHGPAGVGDGEVGPGILVVAQLAPEYHVVALHAQRQLLLNVLPIPKACLVTSSVGHSISNAGPFRPLNRG